MEGINIFLILLMALSICCVNVHLIGSVYRRAAVLSELAKIECDVLCLQECGLLYAPGLVLQKIKVKGWGCSLKTHKLKLNHGRK